MLQRSHGLVLVALVVILVGVLTEKFLWAQQGDTLASEDTTGLATHPPGTPPVWLIHLARRPDRLCAFKEHFKGDFKLWSATDGLDLTVDEAHAWGVNSIISEPCAGSDHIRNPGVLGCWISHKRLLQELQSEQGDVFIIAEDDAALTVEAVARFEALRPSLPPTWTLFFLGLWYPSGSPVTSDFWRLDNNNKEQANWGTHAYAVQRSSLPLILQGLRFMTQPIDLQLSAHFDVWEAYAFTPDLLVQTLPSSSDISGVH